MSLRHALLGLLADRPTSGYELSKQFEISLAHVWSAGHSQIYPELVKMAAAGLVEAGAEGPRNRKEYRITDAGRAELNRWLTETRPDRSSRNESMLRIFFLWTLPQDDAVAYLEREADDYAAHGRMLIDLDQVVPWTSSPAQLPGRLALEQGIRWAATMADWATWAADQLRAGHDATSLTDRHQP